MEDHQKISFSNSLEPFQQIIRDESKVFSQHLLQNQYSQLNLLPQSSTQKFHQDKTLNYFKMIFSPKEMADSIKRRNENLQMLNFQNSDQEPDDIFNRRKKKVIDLMTKQEEQLQSLLQIKKEDEGKFVEIIDLLKFLCELKEKLIGARTEYYSNKTFCALKNSSSKQISQLTKIMKRMYGNIIKQSQQKDSQSQSTLSNHFNQRINQFLILPRFLISREKIIRFCKNQVLQNNLQFLIAHKCLGHYNNQANKKMPEETQMIYVRNLLGKKLGREKFKKICSINHGNKFLKSHGKAYYQLYSKSMEYLKQLDAYLKKGKKYQTVLKQLQKISQNDQISLNQNESSVSLYNFKNFDACLSKMEKSNSQDEVESEMKDELSQIDMGRQIEMMKIDVKRMLSLPQTQKKQAQKPRGFFVKKYQSMNNAKTTENIILIPPPFNNES